MTRLSLAGGAGFPVIVGCGLAPEGLVLGGAGLTIDDHFEQRRTAPLQSVVEGGKPLGE